MTFLKPCAFRENLLDFCQAVSFMLALDLYPNPGGWGHI
jgi:hypothetical protein